MEKRSIHERLEKSLALLSSLNTPIHKAASIEKRTPLSAGGSVSGDRGAETGKEIPSKGNTEGITPSTSSRAYDYEAYLSRVGTFAWMAKPVWLSPMECARYGWENTDVDVLHCLSCDAYISGHMPDSFNIDVYTECVARIATSLCSGHREVCPWFSSHSPEYFMDVPLHDTQTAVTMFKEFVGQLSQLGEKLPLVTRSQAHMMGISDNVLKQLLQLVHKSAEDTDESDEALSAVILAMCGWNLGSSSRVALINCSLCNRNVGLWNFTNLSKTKKDICKNGHASPLSTVSVSDTAPALADSATNEICTPPEDGDNQVVPTAEGYNGDDMGGQGQRGQETNPECRNSPDTCPSQTNTADTDSPEMECSKPKSPSSVSTEQEARTVENVIHTGEPNVVCSEIKVQDSDQYSKENQADQAQDSQKEDCGNVHSEGTVAETDVHVPEEGNITECSKMEAEDSSNKPSTQESCSTRETDLDKRRTEPLEVKLFQPIDEHRQWCPWVVQTEAGPTSTSTLPSTPPRTHPNRRRYLSSPTKDQISRTGWKRMFDLLVPKLSLEKGTTESRPMAVRRALSLMSSPIPRKSRKLTTMTTL